MNKKYKNFFLDKSIKKTHFNFNGYKKTLGFPVKNKDKSANTFKNTNHY